MQDNKIELKRGDIVEWQEDAISNIIYKGDRAIYLGESKFRGVKGSIRGRTFYEFNDKFTVIQNTL
ncbi:hypothetical protein KLEB273_gp250 [Bacillus phage vB_BauM_KLEB27-3]|nr:hypothetical protein KLEB273_gp250 [Bacillus phage vB_BauM_KLEB27-3]